jgi:mono/diheme cytochrome c family protein
MTMQRITRNLLLLAIVAAASSASADDAATLKLFKAQCATCHGLDGKGQTTAGKKAGVKDWTDPKVLKVMSDVDVEKQIRVGKNGDDGKELMPSFTKLGDSKIKALIAYIRAFQPN